MKKRYYVTGQDFKAIVWAKSAGQAKRLIKWSCPVKVRGIEIYLCDVEDY